MPAAKPLVRADPPDTDAIRFPTRLRERIAADAERCGRSFEAQVVAILRRHFGEDVDIAPAPSTVLALARGSFAGMTRAEERLVTTRLREGDAE
ncbi:MAG: hypothetical protein ABI193_13425 [Minicystis sp.]